MRSANYKWSGLTPVATILAVTDVIGLLWDHGYRVYQVSMPPCGPSLFVSDLDETRWEALLAHVACDTSGISRRSDMIYARAVIWDGIEICGQWPAEYEEVA